MDDDKRLFVTIGLGMIGAAILFGLLGGISDAAFGPLASFSGTLLFFGIVILLVGAFRGRRGQQQQQQVVVLTGGGNGPETQDREPAVRCPDCEKLNPMKAAFCGQCGRKLGRRT